MAEVYTALFDTIGQAIKSSWYIQILSSRVAKSGQADIVESLCRTGIFEILTKTLLGEQVMLLIII